MEEYTDLREMCKKYSVEGLNYKKIGVFAEHVDTVEAIIDKKILDSLNRLGHLIESIEMSDCY